MKWLQSIWYRRRLPFYVLLPFLFPFSWLYRSIVVLRCWCYRAKLFKTQSFPVPIIIVGNLTVGGTGKTPIVVALIELLRQQGWRPGVISRGYKGKKSDHPVMVKAESNPKEVGDEPVLIVQRTNVPLVVAKKRTLAAQFLLANSQCDVIIADDGLQHYALARDIEIAVIDVERAYGNRFCLPLGPLREPMSRLKKVDLQIVVGESTKASYSAQLLGHRIVQLINAKNTRALSEIEEPIHAIAGIGHPARFFNYLRNKGLTVIEHSYADHYAFSAKEMVFDDDKMVIMTEKDAVKCRQFADERHWYLPVTAQCNLDFCAKLRELLHEVSLTKRM